MDLTPEPADLVERTDHPASTAHPTPTDPAALKHARRRRLRAMAKVRARRVETALDKVRARAAQVVAPDQDLVIAHRAAVAEAEREVRELDAGGRVFTRRDTGVQVRLRDTRASADRLVADPTDRYQVACLTHHSDPLYFDDPGAAVQAARCSPMWCEGCRQLGLAAHSVRDRIRAKIRAKFSAMTGSRLGRAGAEPR